MERETVECRTHGEVVAAYVCEHLLRASGVDWYSARPDEANPWPDAWCGECQKAYAEAGEWNEQSEAKAGLKAQLLCHHCYERTRATCDVHYV